MLSGPLRRRLPRHWLAAVGVRLAARAESPRSSSSAAHASEEGPLAAEITSSSPSRSGSYWAAAGPGEGQRVLSVQQTVIPGHLAVPGDRIAVAYTVATPGVTSPTGTLFVRTDSMTRFVRVPLTAKRAVLQAVVPARLIRGEKLLYYTVVRDPDTGRSATIPAAGARAPDYAFVLEQPVVVRLRRTPFRSHARAWSDRRPRQAG